MLRQATKYFSVVVILLLSFYGAKTLANEVSASASDAQNSPDYAANYNSSNYYDNNNSNTGNTCSCANGSSYQLAKTPQHIALLVPLTGNLAGPGQAIQKGFMDAYHAAATDNQPTQVDVIDTAANVNIQTAYQQAVQQGADFIVGPLDKLDVTALSRNTTVNLPVLTLNYLPAEQAAPRNFFQFGLSPYDEARQAAADARQKGLQSALIVAPESEWGRGVAQAFMDQWQALGGNITDQLFYRGDMNSYTKQIGNLLQVQKPANRHSAPTRRQDFDVVFLAANPYSGRQISAILKYDAAADVPVYATSLIYAGTQQPTLDAELNGVTFFDVPWVFNADNNTDANSRLYALGVDAYQIAMQLNRLSKSPGNNSMNGDTGKLYLNNQQRIVRQLMEAKFQDGIAQPVQQ